MPDRTGRSGPDGASPYTAPVPSPLPRRLSFGAAAALLLAAVLSRKRRRSSTAAGPWQPLDR
jgi:hypothetical protein